jgi:hypothetical protein
MSLVPVLRGIHIARAGVTPAATLAPFTTPPEVIAGPPAAAFAASVVNQTAKMYFCMNCSFDD